MSTERRILLAAERLFAERGVDGVSLRAVMAAAGTNVAAVHYHFGSKDALVEALIKERSEAISAKRAALLDRLEGAETFTARQLAEAFVDPVAEVALSGGEAWVSFVSSLINSTHPAMTLVTHEFFEQARRFTKLLQTLHPQWPTAKVLFRLSQAMTLTFQVLGDIEGVQRTIAVSKTELSRTEVVEQLLDLVTASLEA
ncbi:TetR family transcriptional regulator [Aldersonia kunmingensis]|uniref:TetR family transcriptional regulator n=1 Tax=Aldersonia kunmingensis TaxID=408066 RepID=UPI000833743D|nr:TetR family transcriptional regulator [Aldersonia kunmingensis]